MHRSRILFLILFCSLFGGAFSQEFQDSSAFKALNSAKLKSRTDSVYVNPSDSNPNSIGKNSQIVDFSLIARKRSSFKSLEKTGRENDTSAVIYGWTLDKYFIQPEKSDIDTDLVGFQVDNPMIERYVSASFLGNVGSAYIPNYFFDRDYTEDLLFLNSYKSYFNTFDNTCYINTRKPFTNLVYYNAGSKRDKYETIEVTHSQNVNKKLNFGFNIKVLSDRGQYKYLDVKNKNFKAFTSYSGDRYKLHTNFNINRYQASENGGILDSVFLDTNYAQTKAYPVNFSGIDTKTPNEAYVTNKVRYIDFFLSQQLKLFTIGKSKNDSVIHSSFTEPSISHVFIARRCSKIYQDGELNMPVNQLYSNAFVNPLETYDSIAETRFTNKFQFDFKARIRKKVLVGVYGNIGHDYIKYSYYSLLDSTLYKNSANKPVYYDSASDRFYYVNSEDTLYYNIFRDRNKNINSSIDNHHSISNVYVSGGIYGKFWTYFQSQFSATIYLAGYKAGQTRIDGELQSQLTVMNKPYHFIVIGSMENIVPSYQLNNYYSNNYIWEGSFNNYTRINLSSKIVSPSNKFELSGNYTLLRKYVYLTNSDPVLYNQAFNLFAISLERDFKLGEFHSYNKVIYQASENEEIVGVPTLIVYNSTYIDHNWIFRSTGGELRTMIGFDVHYNSYFKGYNYIPARSMFYQENEQTIGGYAYIDFWLNVKLKRTRFFAKYEHANSSLGRKDYFNAISYPAKQNVFKFGISWTFYD
jgi:hypothetical protein